MLLLNFQFPHVLLTSIHEYRHKGDQSVPNGVLTFYSDLVSSHELCLIRLDLVGVTVTKEEMMKTLDMLFYFYLNETPFRFVEQFNNEPKNFNFQEFINSCNKLL